MIEFLGLGTTLAFLDLSIKNQIEAQNDEDFPRDLEGSKGKIKLYKNHNSGFSFGVLKKYPKLVETVPLCMTSGLAGAWFWLMGRKGRFLEKTAMTLALAGGASNLYDRLKRGYVVDYFSFQWKGLKKVVFNLGDMFIILGSALLIVSEFVETMRDQ